MCKEIKLIKESEEVLPVPASVIDKFVGRKIVNISARKETGKKVSSVRTYSRICVDITFENGEILTIAHEEISEYECGPDLAMARLHIGEHTHILFGELGDM